MKITDGKISPHFHINEVKCKCGKCGQKFVNLRLVELLEKIRCHFKKAVIVHSWNRCTDYNKKVGGAKGSFHVLGMACDFHVMGIPLEEVYQYCDEVLKVKGLGKYDSFIHIDVRTYKARWRG